MRKCILKKQITIEEKTTVESGVQAPRALEVFMHFFVGSGSGEWEVYKNVS